MPRILTYNVHRCVGADGRMEPGRIAEVIARAEPDIVALQELDVGRARTCWVDQAHAIARELRMGFHFHPALRVEEEQYGDAILTALPSRLLRAGPLPGLPRVPGLEPRGALWIAVEVGGVELQVVNTHLGLLGRERLAQAVALLGPDWLGHPDCRDPLVLLGDFNAPPRSVAYRLLSGPLRDAQHSHTGRRPRSTYPARLPVLRIDHVFVSRSVEVLGVEVPRGALERVASDHLPLVANIRLGSGTPDSRGGSLTPA